MKKRFLLGIFIIFVFALTCFNISQAASLSSTSSNKAGQISTEPHWKTGKITVYIPKDPQAAMMRRAFLEWQNLCSSNLNFIFVQKGPANIDVVFTEKVDGTDGPLGSYRLTIQKNFITKAEIKIATRSKKNYSNNYIYTTMIHEIGHALGLSDTNRQYTGIMYMPISEEQNLTKNDKRKLYKLNGWGYAADRLQR